MKISLSRINIFLTVLYAVVFVPLWVGLLRDFQPSLPVFEAISRPIIQERQRIREQSKPVLLNLLMPPEFKSLTDITVSGLDPQTVDLEQYVKYFKQASISLPPPMSADAHALLGFCYYHQGKKREASESYLKSLEENPALVWTYTNLALLRFQEGDYEKAAMFLNQALQTNPETSVRILVSSKIYTDILRDSGSIEWPAQLKKTYSDAARLLVLSFYRMGKFPETIQAAKYAINAGFEPFAFFYYYIGLTLQSSGEPEKAKEFLSAVNAAGEHTDLFTGQDLSVRIF